MNVTRNGAIHRVQTGKAGPQGPAGSVQLGDIDQPPSAALAGAMRYQQIGTTGSVLQICMRDSTGDYVWTDIIIFE